MSGEGGVQAPGAERGVQTPGETVLLAWAKRCFGYTFVDSSYASRHSRTAAPAASTTNGSNSRRFSS